MSVYDRLVEYKDEDYVAFQSKLVPNISRASIIGVRTPALRALAKEMSGEPDTKEFLQTLPHHYYEENLLHFFIISMIKDFDDCVAEVERFLPYVDCWAVCDQSSPKVFRKNHDRLLLLIKKWIDSEHVYTARFGIRMLMNEFLGEDFKEEFLEIVANKTGEDYYLKMMVAWFFATALAKQYDSSIPYIMGHRLDSWTHKKAIQKAIESYRVSEAHKDYLRQLR